MITFTFFSLFHVMEFFENEIGCDWPIEFVHPFQFMFLSNFCEISTLKFQL